MSSPPRKRAKEAEETGAGVGVNFDQCPRVIDVSKFVEARALEITQLLAVVNNATLPAGEVAQGPRTFVQRLPRHMRRRAMSYNIKRLPRRMRSMAENTIELSKHRKKPPSRRWRRRPRNLLNEYARRQRKCHWLATHIWHAKRFRMVDLLGWRIPSSSYQRGFRAQFRDAARHCVVQDLSFYTCLELEGPECVLTQRLNTMCRPSVSQTFANCKVVSGRFEGRANLYEPDKYPYDCIGPVRFIYQPASTTSGKRRLWIFVHPALETQLQAALERVFDLTAIDSSEKSQAGDGKNADIFKSAEGVRSVDQLHASKLFSPPTFRQSSVDKASAVVVRVLKHHLVRFRLIGPKCGPILSKVLHKPSDWRAVRHTAVISEEDAQKQWDAWNGNYRMTEPGMLPSGLVLSLTATDPRLFTDYKRSLPTCEGIAVPPLPPPPPESCLASSPLWSLEFRRSTLEGKLSDKALNDMRNSHSTTASTVIPLLLIQQPASADVHPGLGAGWDLVLPAGWAMPFWVALQYATARAVGLEFQKHFAAETADPAAGGFPYFWPDTQAGRASSEKEAEDLTSRYLRRPANRRSDYVRLRVTHPFGGCPWNELIDGWTRLCPHGSAGLDQNDDDHPPRFYVLRDKILLRRLQAALNNDNRMKRTGPDALNAIAAEHPRALVVVRLTALGKGTPKPRALLCIPTEEDIRKVASMKTLNAPDGSVELRKKKNKQKRNKQAKEETGKAVPTELEFIGFGSAAAPGGTNTEVEVDLNSLFEDKSEKKVIERKAKEKERKKQRRAAAKYKEVATAAADSTRTEVADRATDDGSVWYENIVESCQRRILGYVVDGDYSLARGKGHAIAFCSILGLKHYKAQITTLVDEQQRRIGPTTTCALYRNVQSKYYRAACLSVLSL